MSFLYASVLPQVSGCYSIERLINRSAKLLVQTCPTVVDLRTFSVVKSLTSLALTTQMVLYCASLVVDTKRFWVLG